jgi:hypothetical protein
MRNVSPSDDDAEPPKNGLARDLHTLAQDERVDVDQLFAEARQEVGLDD